MEQKEEFILLWKSGKYTVTNLTKMFDISRSTAYKFIDRYKEFGFPGLKEKDKTPIHMPNKTPELFVKKIIELRGKHKSWGPRKLLVLLEAEFPNCTLPKESTVSLILKRNGLVKSRKIRTRTEPKKPIFDPKKCNEVWSADFKGKFRMGNKIYCHPLTIVDSYSRYVFSAKGMLNPNTKGSKAEFIKVFRHYGLPEQIHTDNGSPFAHVRSLGRLSKLGVWFMELGIKPVFSDPASPQQNGRHERMHRDLKGEATRPPGKNLQAQQVKLNHFIREYNDLRPHEALGMRTPTAVNIRSDKKYPGKIEPWMYPKEYTVRRVTNNGAIRIGKAEWMFITSALAGKELGFNELGNRIYEIYFRQFFLGYADMKDLKVYDIMKYNNELKL
ncbi:MAG: integrase core domain-containing protein [Spirochaetaceae bacterium]